MAQKLYVADRLCSVWRILHLVVGAYYLFWRRIWYCPCFSEWFYRCWISKASCNTDFQFDSRLAAFYWGCQRVSGWCLCWTKAQICYSCSQLLRYFGHRWLRICRLSLVNHASWTSIAYFYVMLRLSVEFASHHTRQ